MLSVKTERSVADEVRSKLSTASPDTHALFAITRRAQEAAQLYETRRAYLHACVEYTTVLHRFHLSLDWLTSKRVRLSPAPRIKSLTDGRSSQFVDAMMGQIDAVQRLSESLQSLKPQLGILQERLTLGNQQFETEATRVEANAHEMEEVRVALLVLCLLACFCFCCFACADAAPSPRSPPWRAFGRCRLRRSCPPHSRRRAMPRKRAICGSARSPACRARGSGATLCCATGASSTAATPKARALP